MNNSTDLKVVGTNLELNGTRHYLRGINMYGAKPYDVGDPDNSSALLSQAGDFSIAQDTISAMKAFYDEGNASDTFNCIRNPISPKLFDSDQAAELQKLTDLANTCKARNIWLMVCPYGMYRHGDYPSRAEDTTKNFDGNAKLDMDNDVDIRREVSATHVGIKFSWDGGCS